MVKDKIVDSVRLHSAASCKIGGRIRKSLCFGLNELNDTLVAIVIQHRR